MVDQASLDYITSLINNKESIKAYINLGTASDGLLQKVLS